MGSDFSKSDLLLWRQRIHGTLNSNGVRRSVQQRPLNLSWRYEWNPIFTNSASVGPPENSSPALRFVRFHNTVELRPHHRSEVWICSRVGPFSPFCTLYSVVGQCRKWRTPWPGRFYHINLRESPGPQHKGVHEEHSTRKERILQALWDDRVSPDGNDLLWIVRAIDWKESFAGVAGFKGRILKLK